MELLGLKASFSIELLLSLDMNSLLKHAMLLVLLTSAPSEDVRKQLQRLFS
jgi:hypothetical protein